MLAPYPEASQAAIDPDAERIMETVIEIVRSIRNARAQYKVEATRWIEAQIYAGELKATILPYAQAIQILARAKPLTFLNRRKEVRLGENALVLVLKESDVVIPMESMVDLEAEKKRLQKEIEQLQAEVARLEAMLRDEAFLSKAPPAVVAKERGKLAVHRDKLERLKQQIAKFD
jgi:valyl-tRNA synthetase